MCQMIQAATFLSPSWRSPTTFEKVTDHHPEKRSRSQNCQVFFFQSKNHTKTVQQPTTAEFNSRFCSTKNRAGKRSCDESMFFFHLPRKKAMDVYYSAVSTHLKNMSQIGSSSPGRGENKKSWKPPPSFWWALKHKAFRETKKTGALDALVSGSIGKYRKSNVPKKPDLDRKSNEKKWGFPKIMVPPNHPF